MVLPVTETLAVLTIVPFDPGTDAVIVVLPEATPVKTPVVPTTVAAATFEDVQAVAAVTLPLVPFP